jgi:hypothetical protein
MFSQFRSKNRTLSPIGLGVPETAEAGLEKKQFNRIRSLERLQNFRPDDSAWLRRRYIYDPNVIEKPEFWAILMQALTVSHEVKRQINMGSRVVGKRPFAGII